MALHDSFITAMRGTALQSPQIRETWGVPFGPGLGVRLYRARVTKGFLIHA
jgi:hypothetical protein